MTGTVYFNDGHTEDIINHNFTPSFKTGTFNFSTASGKYSYEQGEVPVTDALGTILKYIPAHRFYKYNDEWLVTREIDYVEFKIEVTQDGTLDN